MRVKKYYQKRDNYLPLFYCYNLFQLNDPSPNPIIRKKIALLDEYALALEKENFAKNQETSLIYQQLESYQQENQMLKQIIDNLQAKDLEKKVNKTESMRCSSRDFGEDLRKSSNIDSFKELASEMERQLCKKNQELLNYVQQNEELGEIIEKLEKQLNNAKEKISFSEEKVRKYCKKIKNLEEANYELKSNLQSSRNVSFCRLEVEKLVKENNQLIERLRMLEKQKNIYFTQLKAVSPMKTNISTDRSGSKTLLEHSRKKMSCKSQRWNIIEEKLRQIRQQNEQLKANLSIN